MKLLVVALLLLLTTLRASAGDKCDALTPTNAQNVDEGFKGKIDGEIKGLLGRLAGGAAAIEGEYRKLETDELKDYPESDKIYVWQRIIYLACVSPDLKIDINELFKLYLSGPEGKSSSAPQTAASRITVSRFDFKPIDPTKSDSNYEIHLYMLNRGNIPGRAPIMTFSFKSVDGFMPPADVDTEMTKALYLANEKPPPSVGDREEIETGVESWIVLSAGLTQDAFNAIRSGEKRFYLFVALAYTDKTLSTGQYWISEFCASQSKDLSVFQLCPGHNRAWLYKGEAK